MKRTLRILVSSIAIALAPAAMAQTGATDPTATMNAGQTQVATSIAASFTNLAGSQENALALVIALRNGTNATLTTTTPGAEGEPPVVTETVIDPPTRPMGWGNVRILLALAQDQLARLGVTNPTNEQLLIALNGGDLTVGDTTTTLRGILAMRAEGMGMGQIAQATGTKLGPVISALKKAPPTTDTAEATTTARTRSKTVTTAAGTTKTTGKPGKGVTTAAGATKTTGKPEKTLTTGAGAASSASGLTTAGGASASHASRGLVTASGAATSGGAANAQGHGRGLVTAAGGGAGNTAATTHGQGNANGHGQGVVTGAGSAAGTVTTAAHGGGGGNGQGGGNAGGNGRGRGH